jgi:Tol biopolymer transport system component
MKRLVILGSFALALLVAGVASAKAQDGHDLFQQALLQERTYGNLERSLELYATALVQLGSVHEKLGRAEARAAYRQVLRDFSDLREQVSIARNRLATLSRSAGRSGASPMDPTYSLISGGIRVGNPGTPAPYDFSPDGRRLVYRDHVAGERYPGLYVRETNGDAARPLMLLDPARGPTEGLWNPRWSPDGTRIAFTARFPAQDELMGLYVMEVNGGAVERLGDSYESDLCWTNDGLAVTHVGFSQRLYTSAVTGRTGEAPSVGDPLPVNTIMGGYSPDGTLLALDISTERLGRELRDIWIMAADGGERFYVTDAPGFDAHPAWGEDGSLYFVSDRGGGTNVWRLDADAIAARRHPPSRMRADPRRGRGWQSREEVGLPGQVRQVTFFEDERVVYPRRVGGGVAFVLERATNTIRLAGAATPHDSRSVGRGRNPQLSASDNRIVFESDQDGRGEIWVMSRDGGRRIRLVGDLAPSRRWSSRFDLSPDGTEVVYSTDTFDGQAIFVVPVSGGTPRRVTTTAGNELSYPVWSPDGTQIAFAGRRGLFVVPRDGGLPTRLAALMTWDAWSVRWSPDGEHIAALGWEEPTGPVEPRNHVYVVQASGGELRRLTPDDERQDKEGLEWHPDGQTLTYMYRAPDFEGDGLRTAFLDGRPSTLFIDEPATWDYVGSWAPDGSAFHFLASDAVRAGWQLYRRDSSTGAITEVFAGDNLSLPSWGANGETVVWSVERVTSQLWVMEW